MKLKVPLGLLIEGSTETTMNELRKVITAGNPPIIVAVGDVTTSNLMEYGIHPQVFIVDNKVMREPIKPVQANARETIYLKNPAGTLTKEAGEAVQEALNRKRHHPIKVIVDGEEDLLTLPAILHGPENSMVIYGQPHKGVVAVAVTKEKKNEVRKILKAMNSA